MKQHASHEPLLYVPNLVELIIVLIVFGLAVFAMGAAVRYQLI